MFHRSYLLKMKTLYVKYMNKFLMWLATSVFRSRTRIIYTNGNKYLLRVYLKNSGIFPGIYIHRFYDSDKDRFQHDHPWLNAVSLILCGKYKEERLNKDKKTSSFRELSPGKFNFIKSGDFHRVTLLEEPIWTLFVTWNRNSSWGFWDVENQKFIPWEEYTKTHGNYVTDIDGNLTELYE